MAASFPDPGGATAADHAACRRAIRSGSKSFFAASLLLPARVRRPALALYAFCRLADDAVDLGPGDNSLGLLKDRLAGIYSGRPMNCAADRALAQVVAEFEIPRALPEALLEGFQWDLEGRCYDDGEQLNAYASRVAGSVGAMMACLMSARTADAIARACDLGVAMQLTNIARDVGEDARAGRLYLPTSWLQGVGVDPVTWLRRPVFLPQIAAVVARILATADELYARADAGIELLPRDCRSGIRAARHLYAEIGYQLLRDGCDSVARRTVVPSRRKLVVVGHALARPNHRGEAAHTAPLQASRFLVEATVKLPGQPPALAQHATSVQRPIPGQRPTLGERAEWLVGLFERLERRDRQQSDRAAG